MAITLTAGARNGACNGVVDLVDVGGGTAVLEIYDGAVLAVSINLPNPAFGAAAVGVATAAGLPLAGVAVADVPAADNFIVKDRAGANVWTGDAGLSGSGAGVELDNVIIATGQTVTATAWTVTMPAS